MTRVVEFLADADEIKIIPTTQQEIEYLKERVLVLETLVDKLTEELQK